MGRRATLTLSLVACVAALTSSGQAPPATAPGAATRPTAELPEAVRAALASTTDFAFNFDQPGFFAVVEFVKRSRQSPGFAETPLPVHDWRDLIERPADHRGRVITVEGVVGRNKDPYALASRPDLGSLCQVELRRPDQPYSCTVIFTNDAAAVPLSATITVTGYFVMVRQFRGANGGDQQGAVLVAPGPTLVSTAAPQHSDAAGPDWRWLAGAVTLGLVVAIILIRRTSRPAARNVHDLTASQAAPVSVADDLAAWAADEDRTAQSPAPRSDADVQV